MNKKIHSVILTMCGLLTLHAEITFNVDDVACFYDFTYIKDHWTKSLAKNIKKWKLGEIEAYSQTKKDVYYTAFHPMMAMLNRAYDNHMAISISPDMMWLMIVQGLAKHIQENEQQLRTHFVDHKGKKVITVRRDDFVLGEENDWRGVFAEFSEQIAQSTKGDIAKVVVSEFSTTTVDTKAAFEIALMDSMKNYYSYRVMTRCGIPKVTLEGTPKDWETILHKTQKLKKYGLQEWVDSMTPVLQKLLDTANGKIDRHFWKNIYKKNNASGGCDINGWIIKFFPDVFSYRHIKINDVPSGISQVNFIWQYEDQKLNMTFLSGFLGVEVKDKLLCPHIGWAVIHESSEESK
ncbi:DUF4419 domain-containing protein [Candidatus Uabimicrobium amorphum]|uniref:DUF4419 domain-containing protein n=1 Tax=Uabimicrobium amorphum TaxID=2596890 RepID=A0A5S9IU07_UABAM|nr:DUF4419 domain-containing protein [Candidatus Uabimicrobium amorphum]BBM86595.1 hypothetical protein UABAM_04981 [Candidatus Uabimicrobium amorphum]